MDNESNETALDVSPLRTPRVVIEMEGGVIQNCCADGRVDVLVVDRDIEGVADTTTFQFNEGEQEAVLALYELDTKDGDSAWIDAAFAAVASKVGSED